MAITPEYVGAGNRKNTEIVEFSLLLLLLLLLLLCYRDQLLISVLCTHLLPAIILAFISVLTLFLFFIKEP